jgi:hypothetical protein
LKTKQTGIGVSIIEVIAIVVIIADDIFVTTVVLDDDHVPGSQEPSLDLPPLPADRSNFDVHGAINTDQVWILLYQCACL